MNYLLVLLLGAALAVLATGAQVPTVRAIVVPTVVYPGGSR